MTSPNTGLVIEVFSTDVDAAKRIKYWKAKGATVTGPAAYIDVVFIDKNSDPEAQSTASNDKNCVWIVTATL